jgi:hypothetical protein
MKVVAQPIEMISYTNKSGDIKPLRFRIEGEDASGKVIKINNVIIKELEKLAGNPMFVYKCQSLIDNVEKQFEIKYDLRTCKWMLYKI